MPQKTGEDDSDRWGKLDLATLKKFQEDLDKASARLAQLCADMEQEGFVGRIRFDGGNKYKGLRDTLITWVGKARTAYDKGTFAEDDPPAPKRRK